MGSSSDYCPSLQSAPPAEIGFLRLMMFSCVRVGVFRDSAAIFQLMIKILRLKRKVELALQWILKRHERVISTAEDAGEDECH